MFPPPRDGSVNTLVYVISDVFLCKYTYTLVFY